MKIFVTGGAGIYRLELYSASSGAWERLCCCQLRQANICGKPREPSNRLGKIHIISLSEATSATRQPVEAAMRGLRSGSSFRRRESHVDRSIYEPAPVIETNVTGTFNPPPDISES